jgi:uncharacterized protein (DUF302 family)
MRKILLLLLLIVPACTLEQRGAPENDPDTELVIGNPTAGDSIEAIISMPTYAVVGEDVPINIVVRNNSNKHVQLHLTGRETTFDIRVMRADSAVVWRRLRDAVQQILQLRTLGPSESFTIGDRWRASEPGEFLIQAELPTDAAPIVATPARLIVR